MKIAKPIEEKLSNYVVNEKGCWIWQGAFDGRGDYSLVWIAGRGRCTHVVIWERKNGSVPIGLVLDHVFCDNSKCVNPDHLEPKTQRNNIKRSRNHVANYLNNKCKRGHDLTKDNTIQRKGGYRRCKICFLAYKAKLIKL